jgi:hypothetical protein
MSNQTCSRELSGYKYSPLLSLTKINVHGPSKLPKFQSIIQNHVPASGIDPETIPRLAIGMFLSKEDNLAFGPKNWSI